MAAKALLAYRTLNPICVDNTDTVKSPNLEARGSGKLRSTLAVARREGWEP